MMMVDELFIWIVMTLMFSLWAYWPRLVDRFHHHSDAIGGSHDEDDNMDPTVHAPDDKR